MEVYLFFTDIIVGVNIVLILGSSLLALEILKSLGIKESYVLARGWRYIFPAVVILAVIHTYNFFTEFSVYTASRFFQALLFLAFNVFLFSGLLSQFLAIRKVIESRG
jgi:hypothetical protein